MSSGMPITREKNELSQMKEAVNTILSLAGPHGQNGLSQRLAADALVSLSGQHEQNELSKKTAAAALLLLDMSRGLHIGVVSSSRQPTKLFKDKWKKYFQLSRIKDIGRANERLGFIALVKRINQDFRYVMKISPTNKPPGDYVRKLIVLALMKYTYLQSSLNKEAAGQPAWFYEPTFIAKIADVLFMTNQNAKFKKFLHIVGYNLYRIHSKNEHMLKMSIGGIVDLFDFDFISTESRQNLKNLMLTMTEQPPEDTYSGRRHPPRAPHWSDGMSPKNMKQWFNYKWKNYIQSSRFKHIIGDDNARLKLTALAMKIKNDFQDNVGSKPTNDALGEYFCEQLVLALLNYPYLHKSLNNETAGQPVWFYEPTFIAKIAEVLYTTNQNAKLKKFIHIVGYNLYRIHSKNEHMLEMSIGGIVDLFDFMDNKDRKYLKNLMLMR